MRCSHLHGLPGRDSVRRTDRRAQLVFGIFLAHGVLPTMRPAPGLVLRRSNFIQTTAGVLGAVGRSHRHSVEGGESYWRRKLAGWIPWLAALRLLTTFLRR